MAGKVVFLGTGGTIAGKAESAQDNISYRAAQVGISDLLATVPGLAEVLGPTQALSEQVLQLNSKDMDFADWIALAQRLQHYLDDPNVLGVVISHGTDTLEETAYFLHRLLPGLPHRGRPVVLTCAMRPTTSASADGPGNLKDAAMVALSPHAHGVLLVAAGKVHAGNRIQKVHPYRVDAFDSGEAGPLGFVEEGRVRFVEVPPLPHGNSCELHSILGQACPRVDLIYSHNGASGDIVRDLIHGLNSSAKPVRGIVVAGTGNGSLHQDLERALLSAVEQGILVWVTTRCAYGQVVAGPDGTSGPFPTSARAPAKARIDMTLALMTRQ
jgi:L-asparaginase